MPESLPDNHIEWGGEVSTDALSAIMKELGLHSEIKDQILRLESLKKEECTISLEDIAKEAKEKNMGNADRDKKVRETLASEYWIKYWVIGWTSKEEWWKSGTDIYSDIEERWRLLWERLEAVKSLNQTIVTEELSKAKKQEALPPDVRENISKASGIPPEGLDAAIQSGKNPLVNNLVDTFYLTIPSAQDSILKRLPDGNIDKAKEAFSDLRASAREYGVLAPFPAKDLESRIADKSDRSQALIMDGAKAITWGRGDIPVVRTGEQLFFKSPDGKEITHRMDISKIPPVITKIRGAIEISYTVPDSAEVKERADVISQIEKSRKESGAITATLQSNHETVLPKLSTVPQDAIDLSEFTRAIEGISPGNPREKRRESAELIITLSQRAESSNQFQAKPVMNGDELTTIEGYDDYFYGQRLRAQELRKKLDEEGKLEANLITLKSGNPKTLAEWISNSNLDGLERLWISKFASMDEVSALLQSLNGPEMWNRWSSREDIEASLLTENISQSMWEKILRSLYQLMLNISGIKEDSSDIGKMLRTINATEDNGKSRIFNALNSYRIRNKWGGYLRYEDFQKLAV